MINNKTPEKIIIAKEIHQNTPPIIYVNSKVHPINSNATYYVNGNIIIFPEEDMISYETTTCCFLWNIFRK